jgi:hypothetical protein
MGGSSSTAPPAARPRLSRARRRRPTTRRCGTLRRAWRGASRRLSCCRPLRRIMRHARLRSWTRPTPLAPRRLPLALMRDSSTRLRGPTSLPPMPPSPTSPTYLFLCRNCAQTCGWSSGEGRGASSALGSDEAGDDGMDKATRAAIARAYEVDRGKGEGIKRSAERRQGRGRRRGWVVRRHLDRRS